MMQQFEVEATVFGVVPQVIASLLGSVIGELVLQDGAPNLFLYSRDEVVLVIVVQDQNTLSVCLRGKWQWQSSPAFARYLSQRLCCRTLCDPGAEFPDVDPASDIFLEVSHGSERLLIVE
jgi:hypothetical protein